MSNNGLAAAADRGLVTLYFENLHNQAAITKYCLREADLPNGGSEAGSALADGTTDSDKLSWTLSDNLNS